MVGPSASWSSTIRLSAEHVSSSRARRFVRRRLGQHLPAYSADDVELVVSELVTNALTHSQPPFRIRLRAFEQTFRVEVEDGTQAHPERVVAGIFDVTGRGIALVDALSRDWGVTTSTANGKSVWAEFDVP
jgi:anti-sigma regulatory factor (Ser/Thr protein kinase)